MSWEHDQLWMKMKCPPHVLKTTQEVISAIRVLLLLVSNSCPGNTTLSGHIALRGKHRAEETFHFTSQISVESYRLYAFVYGFVFELILIHHGDFMFLFTPEDSTVLRTFSTMTPGLNISMVLFVVLLKLQTLVSGFLKGKMRYFIRSLLLSHLFRSAFLQFIVFSDISLFCCRFCLLISPQHSINNSVLNLNPSI